MTSWDLWSWLAILILGPGALLIFVLFLRDGKKILREMKEEKHEC